MSARDDLPTHYVNVCGAQPGPHGEVYLTLGLIGPGESEIQPLFKCAMMGNCMKDIVEVLFQAYHAYAEHAVTQE